MTWVRHISAALWDRKQRLIIMFLERLWLVKPCEEVKLCVCLYVGAVGSNVWNNYDLKNISLLGSYFISDFIL